MKRWALRLTGLALLLILGLLAPVAYTEVACRGDANASSFAATIAPEHHRNEARTFLTYPEWYIVHAYDDYARVIETGAPHDYRYFASVAGFWRTLCPLARKAAAHGGFDGDTKTMIYTIGVSFTAELLAKAAYEETIGRLAHWMSGRGALDDLSARQARDYARFLEQVPWYKWDFRGAADQLAATQGAGLRDRERRFALRTEMRVKALYADAIAAAVASIGPDELTLHMALTGIDPETLPTLGDLKLLSSNGNTLLVQAPRYRELTGILTRLAVAGAEFTEIAGNDDIMISVVQAAPVSGALATFTRQGYGDTRSLVALKVSDLATTLRHFGPSVEHVYDY